LPAEYGPATRVCNRFNRWPPRGFWLKLLDALMDAGAVTRSTAIDSHRLGVLALNEPES
jgi:hypothetical protein